ncbi:MAG: hypothetical protein ABI634_18455 [Acidobacteriota bacterium]
MRRSAFLLLASLVLAVGFAAPARAADGARFAVLIQGASGEEQYALLHRRWLDALASTLTDRFKYDAAHLIVLSEQPRAGEQKSTAENVRAAMAQLAKTVTASDQLVMVFIGHGGGEGPDAKFNLVGPDLTVQEWNALLKPVAGRLAIVDTTSSSFPYLAGLAAKDRVVITATSGYSQRFHTQFPDGFVRALSSPEADLDKNGRISLQEAFIFASRAVKQYYEQKGTMATESAVLDDTGAGTGKDATAVAVADVSLAGVTYLEGVPAPTSSDPETQRLLARQQALTEQLDELRRKKASMPADQYDKQFEALVLELATVSRDVRQKTAR